MNKTMKKQRFSIDKTIANSKFNYCKNLKWFIIAPLVLILVGVILLCTVGFNLGIDFTGGSVLKVYANSDAKIENATAYDLSDADDYKALRAEIEEVLNEFGYDIKIYRTSTISIDGTSATEEPAVEIQYQDTTGTQRAEIKKALQEKFGYFDEGTNLWSGAITEPSITTATASSELLMNCFIAMLVAIALILVYVGFRFEFTSGLAAILALFHDLLIMVSCVLIFRIQINASFVAALVTILGYSINNTIIIFDRIRENRKSGKFSTELSKQSQSEQNTSIANSSVKETMTRSILTTLTTVITIALVAIIGVRDIREFALPIMFGLLAGFYSSVFLTPGLWAIAYRPRKKKAKTVNV